MPHVDDLEHRIAGLLQLQRVSWQLLADHATTAKESRAVRSQLRKTSKNLRTLFEMRSQQGRSARSGEAEQDVRLWPARAA